MVCVDHPSNRCRSLSVSSPANLILPVALFAHPLTQPQKLFRSSPNVTLFAIVLFCAYIRSLRIRCSASTATRTAENVVNMLARVVLAVIMNMMIIWSLAACCTDEPPRMAPVIIPGMEMMPRTDMLLIGGVSARRRASMAIGRQASMRVAPKARYISTLSRFSL